MNLQRGIHHRSGMGALARGRTGSTDGCYHRAGVAALANGCTGSAYYIIIVRASMLWEQETGKKALTTKRAYPV